jgi:hypothetical protein
MPKLKNIEQYLDRQQKIRGKSYDKLINIARSYWFAFKLQAKSYNRKLKVPEVSINNHHVEFRWWLEENYKDVSTELVVDITEKDSYYYFENDKRGLVWEKQYEPLIPPYGIPTDIYNKVLLFTEEETQ